MSRGGRVPDSCLSVEFLASLDAVASRSCSIAIFNIFFIAAKICFQFFPILWNVILTGSSIRPPLHLPPLILFTCSGVRGQS